MFLCTKENYTEKQDMKKQDMKKQSLSEGAAKYKIRSRSR